MEFKDRLKDLRTQKHLTQEEFSRQTGIGRSAVGMYESGKRKPSFEVLELIADFFNVNMGYLAGKESNDIVLSKKEERQIENDLEDMMHSMASAAFNGNESDNEDIEAFKATLKSAMIQAKKIAKKKYTPRKYRHE